MDPALVSHVSPPFGRQVAALLPESLRSRLPCPCRRVPPAILPPLPQFDLLSLPDPVLLQVAHCSSVPCAVLYMLTPVATSQDLRSS
jgi:hypothetical protein